jgi:hypothetical protein
MEMIGGFGRMKSGCLRALDEGKKATGRKLFV